MQNEVEVRTEPPGLMQTLKLYNQLARPFTLLPPLLGIVSGAICAFGSAHNPDPYREVTASVLWTVALGALCGCPDRQDQRVPHSAPRLRRSRRQTRACLRPRLPGPAAAVAVARKNSARQGHALETLPAICAIHFSRFIKFGGNILQRGQEDDHVVADRNYRVRPVESARNIVVTLQS